MRIFQVLSPSTTFAVPGNQVWRRYLHDSLVDLGHDVVLSADEGRRARAASDASLRAEFSQRLVDRFRDESRTGRFDLAFTYLMDGMIETDAIEEIRRTGVPTCNFSCNNIHQFDLVHALAPHFDLNLHSERDVGDKFRAVGATPLWWPMAAHPRYAHPVDVPREFGASFVGSNYAPRAEYALHLLDNGVDLHLFGPGWTLAGRWPRLKRRVRRDLTIGTALTVRSLRSQTSATAAAARIDMTRRLATEYSRHAHAPVSDDGVVRLYSSSHVSLGFLEVFDGHDPAKPVLQHLHLREFEAPMSGALYLTNYSDELAEHFEPDTEVLVWRDRHEFLEKARYYAEHPRAGEQIRRAGSERALGARERRPLDRRSRVGVSRAVRRRRAGRRRRCGRAR
jgi:hypothetical protein